LVASPLISRRKKAVWAAELVWILSKREKSPLLPEIEP
jgi:hypothetical protein